MTGRWRSWLFVPAHVERFEARAHQRGADGVILDIEDAVPPGGFPNETLPLGPALALVAASRAAGVLLLGFAGSIGDHADTTAYRARITQARQLGFAGAMAVHPPQVAILNEGFAPTSAELTWARRVVVFAADVGKGAALALDGKMIDAPAMRRAQDVLQQAQLRRPAGLNL